MGLEMIVNGFKEMHVPAKALEKLVSILNDEELRYVIIDGAALTVTGLAIGALCNYISGVPPEKLLTLAFQSYLGGTVYGTAYTFLLRELVNGSKEKKIRLGNRELVIPEIKPLEERTIKINYRGESHEYRLPKAVQNGITGIVTYMYWLPYSMALMRINNVGWGTIFNGMKLGLPVTFLSGYINGAVIRGLHRLRHRVPAEEIPADHITSDYYPQPVPMQDSQYLEMQDAYAPRRIL